MSTKKKSKETASSDLDNSRSPISKRSVFEKANLNFIPKTKNQIKVWEALNNSDNKIVVITGPAGTGKTLLSVIYALQQLKAENYDHIILNRPILEALGESVGTLPGGISEKVDPYFRPIYDFIQEYLTKRGLDHLITNTGTIELLCTAYARGRTIRKGTIFIADEFQNTTESQAHLLLTRIGKGAKLILTMDPDQCDLPKRIPSGGSRVLTKLKNVKGLQIVNLTTDDIQRDEIVKDILDKWDAPDEEPSQRNKNGYHREFDPSCHIHSSLVNNEL